MDSKDNRLKYVELPKVFQQKASEIKMAATVQARHCEKYAQQLARRVPKSGPEFEIHEAMKEFVISTHKLNTDTLELINYLHGLLQEVSADASVLIQGAIIRDRLKDAGESLELAWQQRDDLVNQLRDERRGS
jgi:hypothetical protein